MDNFETKDDHKKRSVLAKLFLPAAVISSIGFGVYTYQNAETQNIEEAEVEPKVVAFADLNTNPENTEFDKLVRKDIKYSNEASQLFGKDGETTMLNSHNPMSSLARFSVGVAGGPHRVMINHPKQNQAYWNDPKHTMTYEGWTHYYGFLAFSDQVPGSKRVAVGVAGGPHRTLLNHPKQNQAYWQDPNHKMNYEGWKHYTEFWAFSGPRPGAVRVAVGQAGSPHRMMINHPKFDQNYWNQGNSMTVEGWSHYYDFWAYPADLKMSGLEYELDKAQIVGQKPLGVFHQTLINRSSVQQTNTITFEYTKSESYSWSHSIEVGIEVTAGGTAGVPTVGSGEWSVSVSTKYNYQQSKSVESSETRQYSSPVNVAPGTRIEASCTVQEAKMQVPYEIKFESKWGQVNQGLKGVWNGVTVGHVQCNYADYKL